MTIILSLFSACTDDESRTTVNFSVNAGQVFTNNTDGLEVEILLSPPPKESGIITITYPPANGTLKHWNFKTEPSPSGNSIVLPFTANQTQTSFKVLPILNCNGSTASFVISAVSDGVRKGTQLNYQLAIKARQSFATFNEKEGTVSKNNASGKVIQIDFCEPVDEDGVLFLYPSDCGIDPCFRFTTVPAMEIDFGDIGFYYLPVPFQKGEVGTQFTIIPISSIPEKKDYKAQFRLGGAYISTSYYQFNPNEDGTKYTLTILTD